MTFENTLEWVLLNAAHCGVTKIISGHFPPERSVITKTELNSVRLGQYRRVTRIAVAGGMPLHE